MQKMRQTLNTAILLISHDLGVIAEICERVIVMYAGRVVEDADVRSIFRQPAPSLYARSAAIDPAAERRAARGSTRSRARCRCRARSRQGCPFYARCPDRIDNVPGSMPPMFAFGAGQRAACWVAPEPLR